MTNSKLTIKTRLTAGALTKNHNQASPRKHGLVLIHSKKTHLPNRILTAA
jgi:hypothetical protein